MEVELSSRNPYLRFVIMAISILVTTGIHGNLFIIKEKRVNLTLGARLVYASNSTFGIQNLASKKRKTC